MRLSCLCGVLLSIWLCAGVTEGKKEDDQGERLSPSEIFSAVDEDVNGCLSEGELANALPMIGFPKIPKYGVKLFHVVLNYELDGCLILTEWMSMFMIGGVPGCGACPPNVNPMFADGNGDECLDLKELRDSLALMGFGNLPSWIVRVLWALLNMDQNDCIDTCEFMFFTLMPPPPPTGPAIDDPIFNAADADSDGCLDLHELRHAIRGLFGNLPQMVVRIFYVALDRNHDKCFSEPEWSILTDGV